MPADNFAADMRAGLADRLLSLLQQVETPEWIWFEENLSYDNARFSEALIVAGSATGTSAYINAGLRSLGWLTGRQKSPTGLFRPVGTDSFHAVRAAGTNFRPAAGRGGRHDRCLPCRPATDRGSPLVERGAVRI